MTRVRRAMPAALPRCVVPRRGRCPPYKNTGTSPSAVIPVGRALPAALPPTAIPRRGHCPRLFRHPLFRDAGDARPTRTPAFHRVPPFHERRPHAGISPSTVPRRAGTARGSSAMRRSATRAMPALREHRHIAVRRHSTHRGPHRHFTKHRDPRRAGTARGSSAMRRSAARAMPALREHRHIVVCRHSTNDGPTPAFHQAP